MSKYPRTFHLPFSPGTTNDDRIADDISNIIGNEIVITEKLDGSNCAIEKGGVYDRSHAVYTDKTWSVGVRQIHSMIKPYLDDNVILYGENMEGIHSIEYKRLTTHFYMFGVKEGEYFTNWKNINFYSNVLGVTTVPVWYEGIIQSEEELKEIVNEIISKPSRLEGYDTETQEEIMEGIVIRPKNSFHEKDFHKNVFKWVRKSHVKTNDHWTKNWKRAKINW